MRTVQWPYNLPIWRRFYRATAPDGQRVALIDPAYEVSMGNPTSGLLCVTGGPHIQRCNPSFAWSDVGRQNALLFKRDDQEPLAAEESVELRHCQVP